jgi:hypothetical protein
MTKPFIDTIQSLSVKDKRALVKSIREMIKDDIITNKRIKALSSKQKEQEKKMKIEAQIKAAADKLAKLQAKLAA